MLAIYSLNPRTLRRIYATGTCWIWVGGVNSNGYGPHRAIYERLVGPVPRRMVLDHTCNVRHCVNPWHLVVVTQSANVRRSPNLGRPRNETCRRGHRDYVETPSGRRCGECSRLNQRLAYAITKSRRDRAIPGV